MYGRRTNISKATYDAVHIRDGETCRYCGFPSQVLDHVFPAAAGGSSRSANLVASCYRCNRIGAAHVFESLEAKRDYILAKRRPEILKAYRVA